MMTLRSRIEEKEWLFRALQRGRLSELPKILETLSSCKSLENEVLEAVVGYMEKSLHKSNYKKHFRSLIQCLVPSERISGSSVLDLLLWALKMNQESALALVLEWIICLLDYSLLPLRRISPLYEVLLRRLPTLSASVGPYLLKILLRITLSREVTPWRIHFMQMKSYNPYIRELLDHFLMLKPSLFQESLLESMGTAYVKVNWLYYREKKSELDLKFEDVWRPARKDYWEALLLESSTFEVPTLHVFEPGRSASEPISVLKSMDAKTSLMNCFSMEEVYKDIHCMGVPDRTLIMLDSPQLYVFLFAREDSPLIIERLSLSLHETLIRDFIENKAMAMESEELYRRNVTTLRKIHRLQTFFQESLPVVNRFLAEYFSSHWDGKSYFPEILRLLSLVQITDYDELFDCILLPLHHHFLNTMSFTHKLSLMGVIKKLLVFWIQFEVPRITVESNKPSIFPRANLTHINPYSTVLSMSTYFRDLVDLGFEPQATDRDVFLHEIFMMYKMIVQVVMDTKFPLIPEPPLSFCYLSLSSTNPLTLNNLMEYLLLLRTKVVPICTDISKASNKVNSISSIASQQVKNSDYLNTITKDVLAVISLENVYLVRGKSLFRQKYWSIEDDKHRHNLSIVKNLAFVRLAHKFAMEYSEENDVDFDGVVSEMFKTDSEVYANYISYVKTLYPSIVEFLQAFETPKKKNFFNTTNQSASTSGVSSLTTNSKRQIRNRKY